MGFRKKARASYDSKKRRVKVKLAKSGYKTRAFARSTKNPLKFTRKWI